VNSVHYSTVWVSHFCAISLRTTVSLMAGMESWGATVRSPRDFAQTSTLRWPSVLDLLGQSHIFNDMSQKKSHSSPRMPICPVFGLVSRICPNTDKVRFAVQMLILTCFFSDFFVYSIQKNCWRPGLCPGPHWGSSRRSPGPPNWTPDGSQMWHLHPSALVPDCGVQIMVTLHHMLLQT